MSLLICIIAISIIAAVLISTSYINDAIKIASCFNNLSARVETGLGHPDQLGHFLSGSSLSDMVYEISRSDPDSGLYHVHHTSIIAD